MIEGAGPLFGVGGARDEEAHSKAGHHADRGFGQRLLARTLPPATLSSTAVHTQLISGFHVVHTTSTPHSVTTLVAMHEAICHVGSPGCRESGAVPYSDFAERTRKS